MWKLQSGKPEFYVPRKEEHRYTKPKMSTRAEKEERRKVTGVSDFFSSLYQPHRL